MNTTMVDDKYRLRLEAAVERLHGLPGRRELLITAGALLGFMALLLLALLLPGRTYLGQYANDFMVFVDGANRILNGQVPNREFHTPLGPLAFLLPAFGWWAGGSLGTMMPVATAAFALMFVPLLIYVVSSRLPLGWALAFGLFMVLLVAVPLSPGEPHGARNGLHAGPQHPRQFRRLCPDRRLAAGGTAARRAHRVSARRPVHDGGWAAAHQSERAANGGYHAATGGAGGGIRARTGRHPRRARLARPHRRAGAGRAGHPGRRNEYLDPRL